MIYPKTGIIAPRKSAMLRPAISESSPYSVALTIENSGRGGIIVPPIIVWA